jgi:hypothetical protein
MYRAENTMFNPSREQVRQFFTDAWHKRRTGGVLTPLETMAADLVEQHPEYQADLEDAERAQADFSVEQGKTNPFLHLSRHQAGLPGAAFHTRHARRRPYHHGSPG